MGPKKRQTQNSGQKTVPAPAAKRVTKVKLSKRVEIDLVEVSGPEQAQTEATTSIRSKHAPHQDLKDAMAAFKPALLDLCELTEKYGETVEVTSAHVSLQKGGRRGLQVNAVKKLKNSKRPLNLTTPLVEETEDGDHDDLFSLLDTLCREAFAYVDGKRANLDLFTKEERAPGNPVGESAELEEPVGAGS